MEVTFQQRAKRGISMKAHHLAALAALSAASALTLAACGGPTATQASAPGPVGASPSMTMPMAMPSPSFPAPVTATSVVITNFAFSPQAIVVKPGAEVTWTNKDADAHTDQRLGRVRVAGLPERRDLPAHVHHHRHLPVPLLDPPVHGRRGHRRQQLSPPTTEPRRQTWNHARRLHQLRRPPSRTGS